MNNRRNEQVDAALSNLLQKLPPEVAERVHQKYEADRSEFIRFIEEQNPSQDPKYWAKRSCTKCNGRGILGTLRNVSGEKLLPCSCTSKNYSKWLVEQRRQYNTTKGAGT